MRKLTFTGILCGLVLVGFSLALAMGMFSGNTAANPSATANSPLRSLSKATTAETGGGTSVEILRQAALAEKYLFAFFWKNESEETATMKKVFETATKKVENRALSIQLCVSDPAANGLVEKFGLDRAPMPLVLAIAPNGAVMGGFPKKITEEALLNAFGSPCTEKCMKIVQDGNLVLLCVQNGSTSSNEDAMKGVRAFAADPRYAEATKIVLLDPSDPAEKPFLNDLKIDPQTSVAVTAFMAPPGSVIAEFEGATDKDELIAALQKAGTGCGPGGCGPGGCGPKK